MQNIIQIKQALKNKKTVTWHNSEFRTIKTTNPLCPKYSIFCHTYPISDMRQTGDEMEVLMNYDKIWVSVFPSDTIKIGDSRMSPARWDDALRLLFQSVKTMMLPPDAQLFFNGIPLNADDLNVEELKIQYGPQCAVVYGAEYGGDLWKSELESLKNKFSVYQKLDFNF